MTKKPNSPKGIKDLPRIKRIEELAADDYVDPESRSNFSDSDIHANEGVTVRDSDNESREIGASKTLAKAENEEKHQRNAEP